jgi:hypothetical protein
MAKFEVRSLNEMETTISVQASSFKLPASHFELQPPFPSDRPARYGIVRPTDYRDTLERSLTVPAFTLLSSHFELQTSHFPIRSCLPFPYRHPWRPPMSSARPPCTRNSTSIIPSQRIRPWRFKPGTHPAKTFRWHRANGPQFQHHRQRIPSSTSSVQHWNIN